MQETINLYEPHEGRWIEVPMEFVHDNEQKDDETNNDKEKLETLELLLK